MATVMWAPDGIPSHLGLMTALTAPELVKA
jgi:hypothetical protein